MLSYVVDLCFNIMVGDTAPTELWPFSLRTCAAMQLRTFISGTSTRLRLVVKSSLRGSLQYIRCQLFVKHDLKLSMCSRFRVEIDSDRTRPPQGVLGLVQLSGG